MSDDKLIEQLAHATITTLDGEHLVVHPYYPNLIHSEGHSEPVQQASGRLQMGEWEPVSPTCGEPECCRPDHLAPAEEAKEQEDLQLVASHAVSLADLYRRGRKAGLLTAQSSGYGG